MRTLTNDEYLKKAREIHGDKYCYDKTVYKNYRTKIIVTCPKHGDFSCLPSNHLRYDCIHCTKEKLKRIGYKNGYKVKNNYRKTTERFINEARKIHGDKYDYSHVNYINNKTKVLIICPTHGGFWQVPKSHLKGCGCNKCAIEKKADDARKTTEQFIKESKFIHGDYYNYDKVVYVANDVPVIVTCPIHGPFNILPLHHLHGVNCEKCKEYKLEKITIECLNKLGIITDIHKRFKWLGKQSLDIYLPEYNVAIECQGIQHFQPIDFAGKGQEWAENLFKINVERDERKKRLCEEHGVKLYYINYNEDIKEKCKNIYKQL